MDEDGACLFRAISYQMYGDQDMHEHIRQQTMDYIVSAFPLLLKVSTLLPSKKWKNSERLKTVKKNFHFLLGNFYKKNQGECH